VKASTRFWGRTTAHLLTRRFEGGWLIGAWWYGRRQIDVAKPEPIKRNDDLIDALRYMVIRIPLWRGETVGFPQDSDDPRRRLARESLKQLRNRKGRHRGRTGGVW
jgi:hypothetical protein